MNIMHYDYSDKTTVPTELLQDPYLSVDTKGLAAAGSHLPRRTGGQRQ